MTNHTLAPKLIQKLPDGPLAIIGDIHGELDALIKLLTRLEVNLETYTSPRILVFVGDLVDRGPNSPGVVSLVRELVSRGIAYCVAGNHELNIIRNKKKEGNGWYLGHEDTFHLKGSSGKFPFPSVQLDEEEREEIDQFFSSLPLGLEREDIRVTHACWDQSSFDRLPEYGYAGDLEREYAEEINREILPEDLRVSREELKEFNWLSEPFTPPTRLLSTFIRVEEIRNSNPVKRITSGFEEPLTDLSKQQFAGGKWRHLVRADWPSQYHSDRPVVVGHYWRKSVARKPEDEDRGWRAKDPFQWSGARGNVFCVDYSVGRRYQERHRGVQSDFETELAALCWPERYLVFESREETIQTTHFEKRVDGNKS